jgi:hypothetical protein
MDRQQVLEMGREAKRRTLQRKSLEELERMAASLGVGLPDKKWFSDPRQDQRTRIRRESKYRNGLIEEIAKREVSV